MHKNVIDIDHYYIVGTFSTLMLNWQQYHLMNSILDLTTVIEPKFSVQQILSSSRGNPCVRGRPRLTKMNKDKAITPYLLKGGGGAFLPGKNKKFSICLFIIQ